MKLNKSIYTIFGYTQDDVDELANILSEKLEIELVRDEDFYEDEGPYIYTGVDDSLVDYLCIREQFRVGDLWKNDFHKICPWAIEINFSKSSGNENRAKKVREILNSISTIKEIDYSEWENEI